ncbi:MAG TPA: hypothetical protein VF278_08035 [Pirellulales bacterium]
MAGFSKLYAIGGLGGFQGYDGINPIELQILVGDADRQWLEPYYVNRKIRPLGSLRAIVPQGPDHPNALLDACLAFYPKHFDGCSTIMTVASKLQGTTKLDFDADPKAVPEEWDLLRKEAEPLFEALNIFEAELRPMRIPRC